MDVIEIEVRGGQGSGKSAVVDKLREALDATDIRITCSDIETRSSFNANINGADTVFLVTETQI